MTSSRSGKSKGDKGFLRDNGLTVFFGTISCWRSWVWR